MLTKSVNVRLSADDFKHVTSISREVAKRSHDPFPDRSTAVRYAVDLVGRIIDRGLLDHVAALVTPSGQKAAQ